MFKSKVVFVIGAGASCEANFPDTQPFKAQISKMVNISFQRGFLEKGSPKIYDAIASHCQETGNPKRELFVRGGRKIAGAMHLFGSIDSFIENHFGDKEIELCGKLGICEAILRAEEKSHLFVNSREGQTTIDFSKLENTWFKSLFQLLISKAHHETLGKIFENVVFIVFNYDRCLEHFLYLSLLNVFKISSEEAVEIVNKAGIFHPYGTVGTLPWMGEETKIPFGADLDHNQLLKISSEIKTYSEQVKLNSIISPLKDAVAKAEAVIFLGFAFHDQNLDILTPKLKTHAKKIFSTGKGISPQNCVAIEKQMRGVLKMEKMGTETHFCPGMDCVSLFQNYFYVFRNL